MRFLYLIMCFLGFSLTLHAVEENEIEPEDPSTQVIVSQLQRINLTPEDLAECLQDNDAMDCMRHRVEEEIPPGLMPVFRHFKQNPRALFNLCAGTLIGGSASWAWARVFTHSMNPAYYVLSKITNHPIYQTDQIGYPTFAMVLLPEIIHNTGVVRRIKRRQTLKNLCEEPKSRAQKALIWTNRLACSLLLAKFFKVYYGVSWQIDHESDEHFTTAADYWLVATYLFSNWWKKYDINRGIFKRVPRGHLVTLIRLDHIQNAVQHLFKTVAASHGLHLCTRKLLEGLFFFKKRHLFNVSFHFLILHKIIRLAHGIFCHNRCQTILQRGCIVMQKERKIKIGAVLLGGSCEKMVPLCAKGFLRARHIGLPINGHFQLIPSPLVMG